LFACRTVISYNQIMPYEIFWEARGVYKRFEGFVAVQDYLRSQESVLGDRRCDDIRYIINDFLGVEGYSVTSDDAEYSAVITRGASLSNPRIRIAYVTTDTKIILLIKLVSKLSSFELKIFSTLAAAREWVDAIV
jgi:hypothetical protein